MRRLPRWLLPIAVTGFLACTDAVLVEKRPSAELAIEMQSNAASQAKVFFDTGAGFNERESESRSIPADLSDHTLLFPLPAKAVRSIRFDPLEISGVVRIHAIAIQKPDSHARLRQMDLSRVEALNEIQNIASGPAGLEVKIIDYARDPQLLLPVEKPFRIHHSAGEFLSRRNLETLTLFLLFGLAAGALAWWWRSFAQVIAGIHSVFDRCVALTAGSNGVVLDRTAIWFYALCLLAFVVFSVGKFHGSSISIAGASYRGWTDVEHTPLLGVPKKVRSDEWSFQTPTILNQVHRRDRLAVEDTLLGPGKAALLGNVPCRHFTQLFRPQFWPFFVLPADFAFSVYWQAKALLLLTGIFTLVLLMTRSSGVAAICALWYFFSAFTQWSYSWASLLPEMVGLFCWTIAVTCYLTVGRNRILLLVSAVACATSAIDFALCAYPPHQVPLIAFGVAITVGWAWSRRKLIWRRDNGIVRASCLVGCWILVATVMLWFYFDAKETILAAASTIYPGQRSSSGGGVPPIQFLSHFLDFWKSEASFPPSQGNICEGSGYLWLAPLTLFLTRPPKEHRLFTALLVSCWAAFLLILCWMLFPIPAEIGRWLMFNRVPPFRCYHALGLINGVIVALFLAERVMTRERLPMAKSDWLRGLAAVALLVALFPRMNRSLDHFFSNWAIVAASAYVFLLILVLVRANKKAFAFCLLVPLILANGLINPLDRGLAVITSSSLFKAAHGDHQDWLEGKWLIYAPWADQPGLLAATGIDVIDCLKIVPDRKQMAVFDPTGRYSDVINRSSYFFALPVSSGQPASFESPSSGVVLWKVHPLDPRLKEISVNRIAFAYQPPSAEFNRPLDPFLEKNLPGLEVYHLQ
jgi:hypothetical protein